MSGSKDFFKNMNSQAVLKHGLLARYAYYFAGRAGRVSGRVAFVDGYAGAGRYDDGNMGSPLLLIEAATRAARFERNVELHCVESDSDIATRLRSNLDENGWSDVSIYGGTLEESMGVIQRRTSGSATLVFVDPFGLALERNLLESLLRSSSSSRPVDVIYHFSLVTVGRMARAALTETQHAARDFNVWKLDEALGSYDWRSDFAAVAAEAQPGDGQVTGVAVECARGFAGDVARCCGMRSTLVLVRKSPSTLPIYGLVLFSRDRRAHWDFADQAGLAYVDWLHHCEDSVWREAVDADDSRGVGRLFYDQPDRVKADSVVRDKARAYLVDHLRDEISRSGRITPVNEIERTYGSMLGMARSTHIRSALRELHAAGLTDDGASNDFWDREFRLLV